MDLDFTTMTRGELLDWFKALDDGERKRRQIIAQLAKLPTYQHESDSARGEPGTPNAYLLAKELEVSLPTVTRALAEDRLGQIAKHAGQNSTEEKS
jgi:hypothetical protein